MEERLDYAAVYDLVVESQLWLKTRFRDLDCEGAHELSLVELLSQVNKEELTSLLSESCALLHRQNVSLVEMLAEVGRLKSAVLSCQDTLVRLQDRLLGRRESRVAGPDSGGTGGPWSAFVPPAALPVKSPGHTPPSDDNEVVTLLNLA